MFCISLAHLCFLKFWDEVLDHTFQYYTDRPPNHFLEAVTVLTTFVVAAVFWLLLQGVRRTDKRVVWRAAEISLIALLVLVPLNTIRKDFLHLSFFELTGGWVPAMRYGAVFAAMCVIALVIWRFSGKLFAAATALVWILVPLLPVTLVNITWRATRQDHAALQNRPVSPLLRNSSGRVIVVVFDEMDSGLAAAARPAGIDMPAWDRLVRQSLNGTRATSPADNTLESVPSSFIGRKVAQAKPASADTLLVRFEASDEYRDWKREPSFSAVARNRGLNVGIAGWYHPYCRIVGDTTVSCFWMPASGVLHREESVNDLTVLDAMSVQIRRSIQNIPGLAYVDFFRPNVGILDPDVRKQERTRTQEEYKSIHARALELVATPELNIVYLHYPVPHMLTIYDRETRDFSVSDGNNYFDNLLLVDRTIAEIQSTLDSSGLSTQTAVVITSDHALRLDLYRSAPEWNAECENAIVRAPERFVPFVVKLPSQTRGLEYARPFNTVIMGDFVLAMLSRKIETPEQAADWLSRNSGVTRTSGDPANSRAAMVARP